jgi:hypothetical protein
MAICAGSGRVLPKRVGAALRQYTPCLTRWIGPSAVARRDSIESADPRVPGTSDVEKYVPGGCDITQSRAVLVRLIVDSFARKVYHLTCKTSSRRNVRHRDVKIDSMSAFVIDSSDACGGLRAGQHRIADGRVWASTLVRAAASAVTLECELQSEPPSSPDEWPVELRVSERQLILVAIEVDGAAHESLDRLEVRAARLWRRVTRDAGLFEPRPWIGAIRIASDRDQAADVAERLRQLVMARTLDAACVVATHDGVVWSPRSDMSIEAFQAALVGRCLYLGTMPLAS